MFMRPAMEADLQAIKKIYMEAFSLVERAPFSRIIKQWRSGELDILTFREEDNSPVSYTHLHLMRYIQRIQAYLGQ